MNERSTVDISILIYFLVLSSLESVIAAFLFYDFYQQFVI